jgi:hypothetical protein
VLSDHHWRDPIAGLRELRRVSRRVVVFQFDNELFPRLLAGARLPAGIRS